MHPDPLTVRLDRTSKNQSGSSLHVPLLGRSLRSVSSHRLVPAHTALACACLHLPDAQEVKGSPSEISGS